MQCIRFEHPYTKVGIKIYLIESETEIYEGKFQVIFMPEHIKSKTDITSLFINS